jgi:hypothetical protein
MSSGCSAHSPEDDLELTAIADTVDTLLLEFEDVTFVTLASDVVVCELGTEGVSPTVHDLDALLGASAARDRSSVASTHVRVATTLGLVTFTSSARPRFSNSTRTMFFRLPRVLARRTADWVRGVHLDADNLAVWIDLPRLASSLGGAT